MATTTTTTPKAPRAPRGGKSSKAPTQEEAPTQETTPQGEAPQEEAPTQETSTQAPKVRVLVGEHGASLALWAVWFLMMGDHTLATQGVTLKQVASFLANLKPSHPLATLMAEGELAAIQSLPFSGEGGIMRKMPNLLWHCCQAKPGDKQAGKGTWGDFLVRNTQTTPHTFTSLVTPKGGWPTPTPPQEGEGEQAKPQEGDQ